MKVSLLSVLRAPMRSVIFLGLLLTQFLNSSAQTVLTQNDISIIGFNSNNPMGIAFTTWVDLAPGTVIRFSDNGFRAGASTTAGGYRGFEQVATWTATTAVAKGTVIAILQSSTNVGNVIVQQSDLVNPALSLGLTNSQGDQVFAYQGTGGVPAGNDPSTFSGTLLFGIGFNAQTGAATGWASSGPITTYTSYLPSDVPATNGLFMRSRSTGASYNGPRTTLTSMAAYRAAVSDTSNWIYTTGPSAVINYPSQQFGVAPTITSQPSSVVLCNGAATSFSVTAADASTYQWQVNTGSGFNNISAAAPYSGTTTSTLNISAVTNTMNGYLYRCIAFGAVTPDATSDPATLTVTQAPVITTNPPNRTICTGGVANYTVAATGATGYQWQVDQGSGFSNLSNGAPYSNVTTSTLTVTGVTPGMSGYHYRCIVSGSCSLSSTSNQGALTVSAPATTSSQTNVSCNGLSDGSASVVASGGVGGYTYSWSPSGGTAATATGLSAGAYTVTVTDGIFCSTTQNFTITEPTAITATTSSTNVTCNGGSNGTATVVASGGSGGYSYSWSPGGQTTATATGLSAGTYNVVISDNVGGCFIFKMVTITQPAAFTIATTKTDPTCVGGDGSAGVTVSGGASPYTYSWSPSGGSAATATNLGAGTYTVTITDANLCTATRSFTLTAPAPLTATTSKVDVTCRGGNNGTATVVASGGSGDFSYSWSPGGQTTATAVNLTAGTYNVLISDNASGGACFIFKVITINQPAAWTIGSTQTSVSCFGGSNGTGTVTVSGGTAPYTYSWAPSGGTAATASGLAAGAYTVSITDANSCTQTKTVTITQPSTALDAATVKTDANCNGTANGSATVTATGGTTPYTYAWSPSGGTGATASGLAAGTYTVTVTDANLCQVVRTAIVGQPTALGGTTSKVDVTCRGGSNGSATVVATGGSGDYSYSWSPGGQTTATAVNLVAGTYNVIISDNTSGGACFIFRTVTVTQPAAWNVTSTQTNATCNGAANGSATVTVVAGGVAPFTYSWSPSGGTAASASGLAAGTYTVTITDANLCSTTKTITITEPATLTATTSTVNVTCFGGNNGSATVTATGGSGNYSYSWSPSGGTAATASGLGEGTYDVTVTDNVGGCSVIETVNIYAPFEITIDPSQTNPSCNGAMDGTISVTVDGGTADYTYLWSPDGQTDASITDLLAGSYDLTVTDANGCVATHNFVLTDPDVLALTVTGTDITCNGAANGSATVSVTGGSGSYAYSWSPSGGSDATASNLAAGGYSVIVIDAVGGCFEQAFVTINEPAALALTTSQTNVSCNGGSNGSAGVTITSGGVAPFTYSWSPSGGTAATATGLTAGTYTLTITDANLCQTTQSFTITQPAAFTIGTSQTDANCNGSATGSAGVSVTGGTAPYTYSWSPSGGTGATANNLTAGTYTVTITDANSCTATRTFTIAQPAALTGTVSKTNVSCFGGSNGTATVVASGGSGLYSYSWSPGGQTTATLSGLSAGTYNVVISDDASGGSCFIFKTVTIAQPAVISITASHTNVSCSGTNDGTATAVVSGGTSPYSYAWSPSGGTAATASGLAAGTYTLTVTDAKGCTATQSYTITAPTALVATSSVTDVSCFGGSNGSATVSVTGGSGTYSYSWSPSGGTAATATGLSQGTYVVTITDNVGGCTTTASVNVNEPFQLVIDPSQTNISCNGASDGSATATVSGGTAPYTYLWSNGSTDETISGLDAGGYTVAVTDANGCTVGQSYTITEPAALALTTAQTNVSCNGGSNGSATVTVTGGSGSFSYLWSPGGSTTATLSGVSAGGYLVIVTDNSGGCLESAFVTISQPSALSATTAQTGVSCNGGSNGTASVTVTGGTAPYTYLWTPSGATGATATGLAAGTYSVLITDNNGCTLTKTFTVTQPAAIAVTTTQTNVDCSGSPNGSATATVTGGTSPYTYSWSPSGGTAATASGLAAGTYTVTVTDANTCTSTTSVTITQAPALSATTAHTDVSCNGGSNGTASITVTGGSGAFTYSWSPSGGNAATATGLSAGTYNILVSDDASGGACFISRLIVIAQPAALNIGASQSDVTCSGSNNGTATATVTGGTAPYTYSWSPSGGTAATATGLSAGTYVVSVTDANGCTATHTYTITAPSALVATSSAVNVSCHSGTNGSAMVSVTGGSGAYTYSWSPSGGTGATASGLAAGTYTVTVTDNVGGCTTTQTVTITEPAALVLTPSQMDISCNGANDGKATVAVTGGTSPYSYAWSPSGGTAATASNLAPGAYTVTVTDGNGCTGTQSYTITEPGVIVVSSTHVDATCTTPTGSANIIVTGGSGNFSYAWSPGGYTTSSVSSLAAGSYLVIVTDNVGGCIASTVVNITAPTAITATSSQTNVSCNGGANGTASVVANGGTAPYTYAWSPSGGTGATASGLAAGSYSVVITDAGGCSITKNFTITQPAALVATGTQTDVVCNGGSTGSATVSVTGGTPSYTYSWSPSGGTAATASGLTAGTYTVTITDANSCTTTQAFTITQPTALVATTTQTNVSCNGGSNGTATVSVTGGSGTYSYSWSPSGGTAAIASGLTAGTYNVIVSDNVGGCFVSQIVTITQPAALVLTSTQTNASCNGTADASITATVTGGTGAYTYSWSPSGGTGATATGLAAGAYTLTVTDVNGCTASGTYTVTQPSALSATTSSVNVSCNGGANGSASVAVTGGSGAYTYTWSPSGGTAATASGLAVGIYTVTITDNSGGCALTESFTITQPSALVLTPSQIDVSCNGANDGKATVAVTGGTPSYTYSWSPSGGTAATASNLAPGTYTVTVTDANGCTSTQSYTITEPAMMVVTGTHTNPTCNGSNNGTASVTVAGGSGNFSYQWSPGGYTTASVTGLGAGGYLVIVTDNVGSCIASTFINVTQPSAMNATASHTNVSCNGGTNGTASVTATGGTGPYTYSWSPGGSTTATATGLAAGTYTVTITDAGGCSITKTQTVTQPAALSATTTQVNIACNGSTNGSATVSVTGGTGTYTYAWSPSGGTAASATGLAAGTYTVIVRDANACTLSKTVTITENPAVGITPSQTNVSCNGLADGTASVTVTGGVSPYTYAWSPNTATTSGVTGLAAGTYTVTVTDAGGCSAIHTFTITEPAAITSTVTSTNVSCNGGNNGSATVTGAGGSGDFTYSWSSPLGVTGATVNNLVAGTYSVLVIDNVSGCFHNQFVTITQPTAIVATISSTDITCNGAGNGSATVTVSGGVAPYTYNWSPSGGTAATATGLAAGTYTVTMTDANGCSVTQTATIAEPAILAASATSVDVTCNGSANGTATVTITGGTAPFNYSWSPSGGTAATATGLAPGAYTVMVLDAGGCSTSASVTINEPAPLTLVSSQTNESCSGTGNATATVTVSGGTAPYAYNWSPSGGSAATATGLSVGTYTVIVTDANGCSINATFNILANDLPTVDPLTDEIECNGTSTTGFSFSGTEPGTIYNWVNTDPSIGLAASGTGDIIPFTATNTGTAAVTATITVTPTKDGCTGASEDVTITVNPSAAVTTVSPQTVCNGTASNPITFTSPVAGTTYTWTNDDPSIGLAASGSGDIASFTGVNPTNTPIVATITVMPVANSCDGAASTFTITVNPSVSIDTVASQTICGNSVTTAVAFTGSAVTGITYNWLNDTPAIGLAASGTGDIASFTAINNTASDIVATVTVTPGANGCSGPARTFNVTVRPAANADLPSSQLLCVNLPTMPITFTGGVPGTVYNWTNDNTSIGLDSAGTGDIPGFIALNPGTTTAVGTITLIPELNGCTGAPQTFDISVMTRSVVADSIIASDTSYCGSGTVTLTVAGGVTGSSAQWKWYSGSCGGTAVGTGPSITVPLTSTTSYFVRAEGPCNATACVSRTITVIPQATVTLAAAPRTVLMPGQTTTLTATITPVNSANVVTWFRNGVQVAGATGNTHVVDIDGLGRYTVKVNAPGTCESVSNAVDIKDSASTRFWVYANPNNGLFHVRYYNAGSTSTKRMLAVYSFDGKLVYLSNYTVTGPYDAMEVNILHVAKGSYVVILTDKDGHVLGKEKVLVF